MNDAMAQRTCPLFAEFGGANFVVPQGHRAKTMTRTQLGNHFDDHRNVSLAVNADADRGTNKDCVHSRHARLGGPWLPNLAKVPVALGNCALGRMASWGYLTRRARHCMGTAPRPPRPAFTISQSTATRVHATRATQMKTLPNQAMIATFSTLPTVMEATE